MEGIYWLHLRGYPVELNKCCNFVCLAHLKIRHFNLNSKTHEYRPVPCPKDFHFQLSSNITSVHSLNKINDLSSSYSEFHRIRHFSFLLGRSKSVLFSSQKHVQLGMFLVTRHSSFYWYFSKFPKSQILIVTLLISYQLGFCSYYQAIIKLRCNWPKLRVKSCKHDSEALMFCLQFRACLSFRETFQSQKILFK